VKKEKGLNSQIEDLALSRESKLSKPSHPPENLEARAADRRLNNERRVLGNHTVFDCRISSGGMSTKNDDFKLLARQDGAVDPAQKAFQLLA
jgi:hypothetical protein